MIKKTRKQGTGKITADIGSVLNPTSAGLRGEVKITVRKDGMDVETFKTRNMATRNMLYGLGAFLKGTFKSTVSESSAAAYIPSYLGIGHSEPDSPYYDLPTDITQSTLYEEIGSNRTVVTPGSLTVTDQGVELQFQSLVEGQNVNDTICEVGLFSTIAVNSKTLLARTIIKDDAGVVGKPLKAGYSWFVEWTIFLTNK